jgi:tetratricopeptide (TPR) repeat protein
MRVISLLLAISLCSTVSSGASVDHAEEVRRATQLYDNGSYHEALALYKKLLETEPKNAELLYEAGLTARDRRIEQLHRLCDRGYLH